jgi:hypothetical protein
MATVYRQRTCRKVSVSISGRTRRSVQSGENTKPLNGRTVFVYNIQAMTEYKEDPWRKNGVPPGRQREGYDPAAWLGPE